jgi:putative serine protease PepD
VSVSGHARSPRRWLLWLALGIALVIGGVVGGLIVGATQSSGSSVSPGTSAASSTASACPVTSVADQVVPSVVTIAASGPGGGGTGSGEVIRSGGYILTNNHVISIAASGGSVEVLFSDGQSVPATITGRDPQTDLAVLKVQTSRQLKVISLGSSSSLKVGLDPHGPAPAADAGREPHCWPSAPPPAPSCGAAPWPCAGPAAAGGDGSG